MEKTKIRRCLFIGLGGTGMRSLLTAKKMFLETYGEIPPMIGFLGLDTNGGEYKTPIYSAKYGNITLSPNEQVSLQVVDPTEFYTNNPGQFPWMPEMNVDALTSLEDGAGQYRSNGRFAFACHYNDITNSVKGAIARICNARIADNRNYELLSPKVEIHVVFSLCGGTGAGTFIDMGYLLRREIDDVKVIGYAVLPDVFQRMDPVGQKTPRVKPNAYGALEDLDYLMHLGLSSKPVTMQYLNGQPFSENRPPYNAVYLVDNRNANNDTYTHVSQLADMIGLSLVTATGELAVASAGVADNIEKDMARGDMDIDNKKAWVAGLGISEIVFNGTDLMNMYAKKVVRRIIERMTQSCQDADTLASVWVTDMHIREDGGDDHNEVTDELMDLASPIALSDVSDHANPKPELDNYLNGAGMSGRDNIGAKLQELKKRTEEGFKALMRKTINQECGVGTMENLILSIQGWNNTFLSEMTQELKSLDETKPLLESALDSAVNDLKEYDGKFFKLPSRVAGYVEDVLSALQALVINRRDALRHNYAIQFYNHLSTLLTDEYQKFQSIRTMLMSVSAGASQAIAATEQRISRESPTFQIDLSKDYVKSIRVEDEEILFSELLKLIPGDEKFYGLAESSPTTVEDILTAYAKMLPTTKKWEQFSIDDVVERMSDEELTEVLNLAIQKSSPLLRYSSHGKVPLSKPIMNFFVGVHDQKQSRLCRNNFFQNLLSAYSPSADFVNIGSKERIIVYRQLEIFPVFQLDTLDDYKRHYENAVSSRRINCHFDVAIESRMLREKYTLRPQLGPDDTVKLWVWGLVLGIVKNEGGQYQIKTESLGDALDDFWVNLGEDRDDAFDQFVRLQGQGVKAEMLEYIDSYARSKGVDYMDELKADVKASYYDKYSQIGLARPQLKAKGYERIADLVRREITCVTGKDF